MISKAECIAEAVAILEAGLREQAARSPREAARAALGARASEEQVLAWVARHRPHGLRDVS